jgi:cytochrome c553
MKTRMIAAIAACVWTGVVGSAQAAGDVEQGRARSLACQACHGAEGLGTAPDIPNLAGQKPAYLQAQLTAFRAGDRKNDFMNAIASQLSDADIANLAAFWTSMPAGGTANAPDPAAEFRKTHMTFPKDFPANYVKYAEDKDGRSWASKIAVAAAKAGKPLPAGSAIIVENLKGGAVVSYAAMEARAGWGQDVPELLKNGDWNYALFDAKKTAREFNYARCLACHKPKEKQSFVFGLDHIAKLD